MTVNKPFRICFSGISIRFVPFAPLMLDKELSGFLCDDVGAFDAEYEIRPLRQPLMPEGLPIHSSQGTFIYQTEEGWLRIYPLHRAKDGCQVACLLRPDGKNTLYYPAALWDYYTSPLRCLPLLGVETLLLRRNAFLLHSSVVAINGKTILFSGPSGAGKSTQADLWGKHLGADILNGDRCVVMKRPDGFYGGGSPWCGTSNIYRQEQYPIAGIFLVNKANSNSIRRLGASAFPLLFSQTLVNSWDSPFMEKVTSLYQDLLADIPIYQLNCLPNEDAVHIAYQTLF